MMDPELLEILVCPKCGGELEDREERSALRCPRCRLLYPVDDGIPVLILDRSKSDE